MATVRGILRVKSILRIWIIPVAILLIAASVYLADRLLYRSEVPPSREYETSGGSIIIIPALKFQLADSLIALASSGQTEEIPPHLESFLAAAANTLGKEGLTNTVSALGRRSGGAEGLRLALMAAPESNSFDDLRAYLEAKFGPELAGVLQDYWDRFFKDYYARIVLEVEDQVREDAIYLEGLSPVALTEDLTGFKNRQDIRAYPSYFAQSVWSGSSPGGTVIVYPHSESREALFQAVVENIVRPPLQRVVREDPVVSRYVEELRLNPNLHVSVPRGDLWLEWMEDSLVEAVVQAVAAKSGRAQAGKARGLLEYQIQRAVFDYLVGQAQGESDLGTWLREHISEAAGGNG